MRHPNENGVYALHERLLKGLQRLQSIYPTLPLVPLNGNKQPLGDSWQNHPISASALIDAIQTGGVEVLIQEKSQKIQPQGFGLLTGRPLEKEGKIYYLMALDQDGASAESKILSLSSGNEPLPKTVAFTSGRTGRCQYLFFVPEELKDTIKTRKVKTRVKGEQVEFRWSNLQSALPPSVHPTTGEYRWIEGCAIDETEIAIAPSWVIKQMSLSEERRIVQPSKSSTKKSISSIPLSSLSLSQLPRHPEQIQIPIPEAIPLELCCRTQVRDWIAAGVEKGSGRNDTAINVGLELVAVERYLQQLGQPISGEARQLFSEYCQRSNMTVKEEETRWQWCLSKNPTPSCSSEAIVACIRSWYWKEHIKPTRNALVAGTQTSSSERRVQNSTSKNQNEETGERSLKPVLKLKKVGNNTVEREPTSTGEVESVNLHQIVEAHEIQGGVQQQNISDSQINSPISLPTQNNPPNSINISENQESLTPMIPDKIEAKQIGQEMQELPYEATLLVAQLAKKIFKKLKQDSRLRNDLQVALDKPTTISINVDGKLAYKEVQGQQPLVNNVSNAELDYVVKALQLKEGQSLDDPRNVTISINGKEVFRVKEGLVELNRFSPQQTQNLSQSLQKNDLTAQMQSSLSTADVGSVPMTQDRTVQSPTAVSDNETITDKSQLERDGNSKSAENSQAKAGYEVITETPTIPATTFGSVETNNDLKQNSPQQTFQSFNQTFLEGGVEPKLAQDAAFIMAFIDPVRERNATEQKTIEQVQQQLVKNSQVSDRQQQKQTTQEKGGTVQFSPSDRAALEQQGLDPNAIEKKASQSLVASAQKHQSVPYNPVVVVAGQQQPTQSQLPTQSQQRSKLSQLVASIKAAPAQIVATIASGLGKIQQVLAGTSQNISRSLGQLQLPMRGREQRRQDLNNLAALFTAREALNHLGITRDDGTKVFSGDRYQFFQKGDSIAVSASERGTILTYNANTGTLKGNLNRQDVEVFSSFDTALNREKTKGIEVGKQSSHQSSNKEQMEIG